MKKLSSQSKYILYGTVFISGMVILTALIMLIQSGRGKSGANLWILLAMIVLASATVVFMFLIRSKLKCRAKLLNNEYFEVYEKMMDMMQASALSYLEKRETRNDLLGLLIDAQNSGRKVTDVIGENLEDFVKQVQDSFGYRNRLLFQVISGIQYSVMYIFMIQFYEWIKNGGSFFDAEPGFSLIILLFPIAMIGIPLMRTMIWKQKIFLAFAVPLVFLGIGVAFMEITYANFMDVEWINYIHNTTFSYVPGWGFLALWSGVFIITMLFKWMLRRLSVSKL